MEGRGCGGIKGVGGIRGDFDVEVSEVIYPVFLAHNF